MGCAFCLQLQATTERFTLSGMGARGGVGVKHSTTVQANVRDLGGAAAYPRADQFERPACLHLHVPFGVDSGNPCLAVDCVEGGMVQIAAQFQSTVQWVVAALDPGIAVQLFQITLLFVVGLSQAQVTASQQFQRAVSGIEASAFIDAVAAQLDLYTGLPVEAAGVGCQFEFIFLQRATLA
ncbi:hypothetical protein D3C76_1377950 [compost metagenome]